MDGAFNLSDVNSQKEASNPSYRSLNDIYSNGSTLEPSLLERDHSNPAKITAMKSRLKQTVESKPEIFPMAEFPALSTSPNGLYSEKLGSFLGFNYQGRPTISKASSFKMEKEDFPALPQSHLPEVAESAQSRSVVDIANTNPHISSKKNFNEEFGILGLIKQIREERLKGSSNFLNRNFLNFGTDISLLDLDINSNHLLTTQMISPFYTKLGHLNITKTDPSFNLPKCFIDFKKTTHSFENLNTQGLFYAYYYFPRDIKQLLAAYELYNRGWKYHREGKRWITRKAAEKQLIAFDKKSMKEVFYNGNAIHSQLELTNSEECLSREQLTNLLRSHVKT